MMIIMTITDATCKSENKIKIFGVEIFEKIRKRKKILEM